MSTFMNIPLILKSLHEDDKRGTSKQCVILKEEELQTYNVNSQSQMTRPQDHKTC